MFCKAGARRSFSTRSITAATSALTSLRKVCCPCVEVISVSRNWASSCLSSSTSSGEVFATLAAFARVRPTLLWGGCVVFGALTGFPHLGLMPRSIKDSGMQDTLAKRYAQARVKAYATPLDSYHPGDPEIFRSDTLWPWFERLRKEDPVHLTRESEFGPYWSVTKHKDIIAVDS